jgi:FixJ family two-component response regulator
MGISRTPNPVDTGSNSIRCFVIPVQFERWSVMQAVYRNTEMVSIPRIYRNRPPSLAYNSPRPERLCDAVYLVDDDALAREEISSFLTALELKVIAFASAIEYLDFMGNDTAACLVVNTHLPGISGLELQQRLAEKVSPPVIFISDRCDIACAVYAMKTGALEFLTKPVDLTALAVAVRAALAQDRRLRQKRAELAKLHERFSLLTPREREVLPLIVGGLLNKQAASVLGISEVTLQIHRSQVMRKMQAESFADLVRMAVKLRIHHCRESRPSHSHRPEAPIFGARSGSGCLTLGRIG